MMPSIHPGPETPVAATETAGSSAIRSRSFIQQLRRASVVALLIALPLRAGEWHYGSHLVCTDCHSQHNSSNGQPMRTDNNPTPAAHLLLRGTAQELCLSCHDGANPSAPDVVEPVSYVSESAAGAFPNSGGVATDRAHHLLNPTPEIPYGGTQPMTLTCVSCHDPHGNDNYRNLRPDAGSPLPAVNLLSFQTVVANGTNAALVYVPSNIIYKSGVSSWCAKCHGEPDPQSDHPVDRTMWGALQASYTKWASTTSPRVPVTSPTDNVIPSHDDQVNCLSCHKAHGSPNYKTLIYANGADLDSTCVECHNQ